MGRGSRRKAAGGGGGGGGDVRRLRRDLHALGLRVVEVEADGNCLFHSFCDQLGDERAPPGGHAELRRVVCDWLEQNADDVRYFVEDDRSIEEHVADLREDSTWGGHLELHALAMLFKENICVHQPDGKPVFQMKYFEAQPACMHLAYTGENHYDSVRRIDSSPDEPGGPFVLTAGGAEAAPGFSPDAEQTDEVLRGTGCDDRTAAERALRDTRGDTDAAIELLIERLAAVDVDAADGESEAAEQPDEAAKQEPEEEGEDSDGEKPKQRKASGRKKKGTAKQEKKRAKAQKQREKALGAAEARQRAEAKASRKADRDAADRPPDLAVLSV